MAPGLTHRPSRSIPDVAVGHAAIGLFLVVGSLLFLAINAIPASIQTPAHGVVVAAGFAAVAWAVDRERRRAFDAILAEPDPGPPAAAGPVVVLDRTAVEEEAKTELSEHPSAKAVPRGGPTCPSPFRPQPVTTPVPSTAVRPDPIELRRRARSRFAREGWIGDAAIAQLRRLSPVRFEHVVAGIFRGFGFEVKVTPPVNDGGKDAIATRGGETFLIECKRYGRKTVVGREDIHKFWAAMKDEGAVKGFFVTTGRFTAPAVEYAATHDVICLDSDWLREAGIFWTAQSAIAQAVCPTCSYLVEAPVQRFCMGKCACASGHALPRNVLTDLVEPMVWRAKQTKHAAQRKRKRRWS